MQKEESIQLKGIAILMMLWLHLFSSLDVTESLCNLVYWYNGKPLAQVLQKITSCCVAIYALLGGYGLAKKVLLKDTFIPAFFSDRVYNLYKRYWLVLVLSVPFAIIYGAERFLPSNGVVPLCYTYFANILGIDYTFNGAWWFFLPYAIITFVAPYLISLLVKMRKRNLYAVLILAFIVQCISYVGAIELNVLCDLHLLISSYGVIGGCVMHLFLSIIRVLSNLFIILFPFICGIIMARYDVVERLRIIRDVHQIRHWQMWGIAMIIVLSRLFIGNSSLINTFYVIAFVVLFCLLEIPSGVRCLLGFFGKHSTNMWLAHYFFFGGYIMMNEIYALRYPLLIYCVLVLLTLLSSYIINIVHSLCLSVYAICKR